MLAHSTDAEVAIEAVRALGNVEGGETDLRALLNASSEEVRAAAVRRLGERLNGDQLQKLLDEHLSQGPYFYNVVVWLDRFTHCPEPFLSQYVQEADQLSQG